MRYCVQFGNPAIEIALIQVKVMSSKSKGKARGLFIYYITRINAIFKLNAKTLHSKH